MTWQATNLGLAFKERVLFRDLNFQLDRGLHLIQGKNGSGKTSFLRLCAGLLEATEGTLLRPKDGRFILDEGGGFLHPRLTLQQALKSRLARRGESTHHLKPALGLEKQWNAPVALLSRGERRKAALLSVLNSSAPCWLIDEPWAHLDEEGADAVTEVLQAKASEKLILVTHPQPMLDSGQPLIDLSGGL